MSWTTPRTWTVGEVPTAAIFNAHVRDNESEFMAAKVTTAGDIVQATGANALARLAVGSNAYLLSVVSGAAAWAPSGDRIAGWIPTVKAADETVTTSTTIQDDEDFTFAIAASEVWAVRLVLWVTISVAGGFRHAFSIPASATGWHGHVMMFEAGSGDAVRFAATLTSELTGGVTNPTLVVVDAVIVNSTNAGNVVFRWAQNASSGNTVVKADSIMMRRRLT